MMTGGKLPDVSIIRSLIIRRQFYRAFSVVDGLGQIILSLPELEDFTYEPWRGPFRELHGPDGFPIFQNTLDQPYAEFLYKHKAQTRRIWEHEHLFGTLLVGKSSLKRVSILENSDDVFYETATRPRYVSNTYRLLGGLAARLAVLSRDLEELHASQNVDAEEFFIPDPQLGGGDPGRAAGWSKLKYLSLTCRHISRPGSLILQHRNDTVILLAGKSAELMPQLEVMELWGRWETGTASIFRFERRARQPRIQLLSTAFSFISKQEIECWQGVVDRLYPGLGVRLEVEVIRLDEFKVIGLASVIELLVLKDRILHPTSLQQLHKEDMRRLVTFRETAD